MNSRHHRLRGHRTVSTIPHRSRNRAEQCVIELSIRDAALCARLEALEQEMRVKLCPRPTAFQNSVPGACVEQWADTLAALRAALRPGLANDLKRNGGRLYPPPLPEQPD